MEPRTCGKNACWSKRSPWLIGGYLAVALVWRLALGRWGIFDLVIPLAVLLAEPFTEWAIHVVILHWRPRTIAGRTIDLHAGREHRRHHADPRDLDIVFVPIRLVLIDIPVLMAVGLVIMPTVRLGLTLAATAMAMLLTYEWTHFLIHSPYRPRHSPYRYLWRAHRLHHYRNEHYWFGVTMPFGDHLLRTFPERGAVELSPTARSLGMSEVAPPHGPG